MMTLEVQIATHGDDGMKAISSRNYPVLDAVSFRVGWQGGKESFKLSNAIDVESNSATCLTENRNILIENTKGDVILFGDNDIAYTTERFTRIIEAFDVHTEVGFICFRLDGLPKRYPDHEFDMNTPVKGYYPSSCEIAVRTSVLKETGVGFDTRFGLGSRFVGCEETVFVSRLLECGVKGMYCPVVIGKHEGRLSTGSNPKLKNRLSEAKGAAVGVTAPWSGIARMAVRAARNRSLPEFIYGLKGYLSVIFHV